MEKPRSPWMRENPESPKGWRIVEEIDIAKDEARGTEDGHISTDNCIAVLDGVSSVSGEKNERGQTPGQAAVQAAIRVIKENRTIDSKNIVQLLSRAVQELPSEPSSRGVPSFVFVAFFPKENMLVRVGDCSYLIDGEGTNRELAVDRVRATLRKRAVAKSLSQGRTKEDILANDPMRPKMENLRNWQDHFTNNSSSPEFGYGVIDGTDVPEELIEYISVPEDTRSIVLASDGYPPIALHMTLRESEEELSKLQKEDPLGVKTGSIRALQPTKEGQSATDDRTYLRIAR